MYRYCSIVVLYTYIVSARTASILHTVYNMIFLSYVYHRFILIDVHKNYIFNDLKKTLEFANYSFGVIVAVIK